MREIEYIELIADNKFKEHIMPIFQKLEKYLDEKTEFSVDLLDEIRALLIDYELRGHISAIIKEAKADKSQILGTYAFSLQSNVTGYIKMENSEQNVRRKKLAKLLLSYINVTRYIVDYNTIEELINRGPQNGEKLVLALTNTVSGAMIIPLFRKRSELYAESGYDPVCCILRKFCSLCVCPLIFGIRA